MTSIIRDGNHFIYFDGKWALIDGPWYESLNSFRKNHVLIPRYMNVSVSFLDMHSAIPASEVFQTIKWQREKAVFSPNSKLFRRVDWFHPRYRDVLRTARIRVVWTCEGGILPALFNSILAPEDFLEQGA